MAIRIATNIMASLAMTGTAAPTGAASAASRFTISDGDSDYENSCEKHAFDAFLQGAKTATAMISRRFPPP